MNYLESTPYIHSLRPARNLGRVYAQNFGFLFSGSLLPKMSSSLSCGCSFSELCPRHVLTSKIIWDTFFVVYRSPTKLAGTCPQAKCKRLHEIIFLLPESSPLSLNSAVIWDIEFLLIKKLLKKKTAAFNFVSFPFIYSSLHLINTLYKALCWVSLWNQKRGIALTFKKFEI